MNFKKIVNTKHVNTLRAINVEKDQQIQYPLPTNALATVTGISAGSRIQVYNVTTAAEIANEVVAGTTWSLAYNTGTGMSDGDFIRVRLAKTTGATAKLPFESSTIAASAGWSILAQQVANTIYDVWDIDGSAQTQYSRDGVNIDVDINAGGSYSKKSLAAWWTWLLTTEDGIRDFWGAFTLEAANSIRQDVAVVDVLLQNTDVGTTVIFTDNDVRYYRSDLSIPYDTTPGFGSIFMDYAGVPLVISTGGSALTPTESAHILGLDTATVNGLIEDVGGNRFTAKALEESPAGGGGLTPEQADQLASTLTLPQFVALK